MKKITLYYFNLSLTNNLLFGIEAIIISEGASYVSVKSNMVFFSSLAVFRDTFEKVILTNSTGIKTQILWTGILLNTTTIAYSAGIGLLTFFFMKFNDGLVILNVFILSNYILGIQPVPTKYKKLSLNKIIQTNRTIGIPI
ncbi:hypothetical protein [Echinicola shivajiensis]|uniref:hypothetical protein n=1 Tax=Echinicola shivajiensis TaxID=1035916 RepID=UPI001BFC5B9D|nr:hypothetical protein [Echinicola shivajiensis]